MAAASTIALKASNCCIASTYPGQGQVVALMKANGTAELFKHLAPWRAQFGVEMDITPAISDADVVANHKVLFAQMDA